MASVEPHQDAIDVALIDAMHAFSNGTGKTETYQTSGPE
jgi:hypothetical protein